MSRGSNGASGPCDLSHVRAELRERTRPQRSAVVHTVRELCTPCAHQRPPRLRGGRPMGVKPGIMRRGG